MPATPPFLRQPHIVSTDLGQQVRAVDEALIGCVGHVDDRDVRLRFAIARTEVDAEPLRRHQRRRIPLEAEVEQSDEIAGKTVVQDRWARPLDGPPPTNSQRS